MAARRNSCEVTAAPVTTTARQCDPRFYARRNDAWGLLRVRMDEWEDGMRYGGNKLAKPVDYSAKPPPLANRARARVGGPSDCEDRHSCNNVYKHPAENGKCDDSYMQYSGIAR